MSEIQRYVLYDDGKLLMEDAMGDLTMYSNHVAALAEKQAEIDRLNGEIETRIREKTYFENAIDRLNHENLTFVGILEGIGDAFHEVKNKNRDLQEDIDRLTQENEALKCCGSCRHYGQTNLECYVLPQRRCVNANDIPCKEGRWEGRGK